MKKSGIWILLFTGLFFVLTGFYLNTAKRSIDRKTSTTPAVTKIPDNVSNILGEKNEDIRDKDSSSIIISKVIDGDTVETQSGERIRYLGINAPEKGQPFSSSSTNFNKELVLNRKVRFEYDIQTKDRYGRTLAYVFVDDVFVNLEMVKKGLAVSETIEPNVKYQTEILEAQREARGKCLGIWKGLCDQTSDYTQEGNCIKIVSINADASGDDNKNKNGEWIEFENKCQESVLMNEWLLKDSSASNEYRFRDIKVEGGEKIKLYSGCGQDSKEKIYWQCPERKYAVWNNSSDHAFLYNEKGSLVSDYQY